LGGVRGPGRGEEGKVGVRKREGKVGGGVREGDEMVE